MPFVARVPEGEEAGVSAALNRVETVAAAVPDYLIRPSGPAVRFSLNETVIDQAIQDIGAEPQNAQCGQGTIVGILDSGVDGSLVKSAKLRSTQYDAYTPYGPAHATDGLGHGTLIAQIISKVVPGAELISIKTFDQTGSISGAIAALYLAQAAGPCDVLNLSFSLNCDPVPCDVCQSPTPAAANIKQLRYFFSYYMTPLPNTVLVAAAGNNVHHLQLPAAFDGVIAAGSFNYGTRTPISVYKQVPKDRYVLAPGGQGTSGKAFAQKAGFAGNIFLHGTSFATAFISGFAAKTASGRKGGLSHRASVGQPATGKAGGLLPQVLAELAVHADDQWNGFNPQLHGLGAIKFRP